MSESIPRRPRSLVARLVLLVLSLAAASLVFDPIREWFGIGVRLGVIIYAAGIGGLSWLCVGHVKDAPPPERRHALLLFFPLLWALGVAPVAAQSKDETITSSGLAPYPYVRSAAHDAAGRFNASNIVPLGAQSFITSLLLGNSNCQDFGYEMQILLFNTSTYTSKRATNWKFVRAAQPGKTARHWSDPQNAVWNLPVQYAINYGGGVAAVQHVHFCLTNDTPGQYGMMTQAQLDAILAKLRATFPNLKLLTVSALNWTGQSLTGLAPVASVSHDDALLASWAGMHDGVWVENLPFYSDGDQPNPYSASPAFPLGLSWVTSDTIADGVHPSTGANGGARKGALSLVDRFRVDPIFWFMWNDVPKPTGEEPPPPPPPVTVPLSGDLTKDGTACYFDAVPPGQTTVQRQTMAPIFCAGL
jgi:hypothetical protein